MSTNLERIECALQDDSRLIVAVGALVAHAARRAGLSEQEQEQSAAAAIDACRGAFALVHERRNPSIRLVVESFFDRIVLTIEYSGKPACSESRGTSRETAGFDRVRYDASDGHFRITMTKYGKLKSKLVD